jgi:hypothetical protein
VARGEEHGCVAKQEVYGHVPRVVDAAPV